MHWISKRQTIIAFSIIEEKYMASTDASKEVVSLQRLGIGIGFDNRIVRIGCDSQSGICLAKNSMYHGCTKNVDVQCHFVREMVDYGKILIEKVDTMDNVVDSCTKLVTTKKLSCCRKVMGLDHCT